MNNRTKVNSIIIIVTFLAYIVFFAVGSIIVKDRDFSQMENRNLQQFPELSVKTVTSGKFMSDIEKYMSDQIILKDQLVQLKTSYNYALNQRYMNGVYFAEEGMMIQDYVKPYGQLDTNIDYINLFAKENPDLDITWMVVPNACYIYDDKMPTLGSTYNQGEVMPYIAGKVNSNINLVNPSNALLMQKDEYLYYETDHHWTMKGAYIGYVELCKSLEITPTDMGNYEVKEGSNEFYGSLYSKAPLFWQEPDTVLLYNNKNGQYEVDYVDEGWTSDSLYNLDNLEIKDKYTTYLDGNHSIIKINSNSINQEKILVIKDSFAHTLLPLLADNYGEIHVVDLRYFHNSVSEYAKENQIEKIIFINNLEFISTDNNFLWLQ